MTALLPDNLPLLVAAPNGIKKLRELILELAVRGKLVPQDPNDEPASELLKHINEGKVQHVAEGKLKKQKPLAPINEEEKPFELPAGWEWTRLGEITNFGTTTKRESIADDAWVLDLEDIEKDTSTLLRRAKFSERNSLSDKNSFMKGDVLYGKLRPYLSKVLVADSDGFCTTEILPFRCYGSFDAHFFKIVLKSPYFLSYVNSKSYGMKMPRLGTEDGRQAFFPLPPLAEQHRIVVKFNELTAMCEHLDAQQTDCESAHARLVQGLLDSLSRTCDTTDFAVNWQHLAKQFHTLFTTESSIEALKQTLLQLSVMGKLAPQNSNEEPVSLPCLGTGLKVKTEKLTKEHSEPYALPTGWKWMRLCELLDEDRDISYGIIKLGSEPKEGGVPTLRCSDVKPGYISLQDVRSVSPEVEQDYVRTRLRGGEILINIRGTLGGVAVVGKNLAGYNVAREVAVVPLHPLLNGHYFSMAMQSNYFWTMVNDQLRGIAYKGLNLSSLRLLPIPIPPVAEQQRIVAIVNQLMAICDQLKNRLIQSRQLNEQLASSLVEQAVT